MNDLLEACANLANSLQPYYTLFVIATGLMGFAFVGVSLFALRHRAEDKRPVGGALTGVLVGAMLLSFKGIVDMVSVSMFNASAPSSLSVSVGGGDMEPMIRLAVIIVMMVGLFQVIKGLVLLKHSAEGNPKFWSAITHIFGGVLCVNIKTFMTMLGNTIGGPLQSTIVKLLGS